MEGCACSDVIFALQAWARVHRYGHHSEREEEEKNWYIDDDPISSLGTCTMNQTKKWDMKGRESERCSLIMKVENKKGSRYWGWMKGFQ